MVQLWTVEHMIYPNYAQRYRRKMTEASSLQLIALFRYMDKIWYRMCQSYLVEVEAYEIKLSFNTYIAWIQFKYVNNIQII